ncbi:hypothetical protein LY76DRAFT_394313 [Colletotrichum caudatum]|nr:hypothetical protein LY76DRAFT_394313 [Colletotrichum caudatum]
MSHEWRSIRARPDHGWCSFISVSKSDCSVGGAQHPPSSCLTSDFCLSPIASKSHWMLNHSLDVRLSIGGQSGRDQITAGVLSSLSRRVTARLMMMMMMRLWPTWPALVAQCPTGSYRTALADQWLTRTKRYGTWFCSGSWIDAVPAAAEGGVFSTGSS